MGFWDDAWCCGEFDVNGVDDIVDLKRLVSSFLVLIIYFNKERAGVLTGAKNGLSFAVSAFFCPSTSEDFAANSTGVFTSSTSFGLISSLDFPSTMVVIFTSSDDFGEDYTPFCSVIFSCDGFFYVSENNDVFGASKRLNGFGGYFYNFYFCYYKFEGAILSLAGTL